MKIKIEDIGDKTRSVRFVKNKDDLMAALAGWEGVEPDAELIAEVSLTRTRGGAVGVSGRLNTVLSLTCARCLKSFSLPVEKDFRFHLLPAGKGAHGELELGSDDMDVAFFDGRVIDVEDAVFEELSLELPVKFLCREDCRGLCPRCGADLGQGKCQCSSHAATNPFSKLASLLIDDRGSK